MGFVRIIKFALQDITRNISLSAMTVLILTLMLLSLDALIIVAVTTDQSIAAVEDQIDVSIHFSPEAHEDDISELRSYIGSFPEVVDQTFVNQDEVLKNFQRLHRDNEDVVGALNELGENPLGPTLIVKTRDTDDYKKIITALDVPEYDTLIESKTFADTQTAIERISLITKNVKSFSIALTILFSLIAFIVIFNTIRVAIYTHRTEIGIKRLVGATSWFIRGPYVLEVLLFSVVSLVISFSLFYHVATVLDPLLEAVFSQPHILTNSLNSHIIWLVGGQFVGVFALTLLSTTLAMRKYLRV